jgi:hypothetical protein
LFLETAIFRDALRRYDRGQSGPVEGESEVGAPGYGSTEDNQPGSLLTMAFRRQKDDWRLPDGTEPVGRRSNGELNDGEYPAGWRGFSEFHRKMSLTGPCSADIVMASC